MCLQQQQLRHAVEFWIPTIPLLLLPFMWTRMAFTPQMKPNQWDYSLLPRRVMFVSIVGKNLKGKVNWSDICVVIQASVHIPVPNVILNLPIKLCSPITFARIREKNRSPVLSVVNPLLKVARWKCTYSRTPVTLTNNTNVIDVVKCLLRRAT